MLSTRNNYIPITAATDILPPMAPYSASRCAFTTRVANSGHYNSPLALVFSTYIV